MPRIIFGGLKADRPDLLNGELEGAENCVPYSDSYGPFPAPVPYSSSVGATVINAYSTKDLTGNVYTFLGTEGSLWKESSTAINNISRTASYTTSNDGALWEFETFGNTVVAANGADKLNFYEMGTSTTFLDMSASSSAPLARHIAIVKDFLVTGHQPNAENRIQWSRQNNVARYDVSQRYQSDFQPLPGTDQLIKRITGGDTGHILTNTSAWLMTYVGSPIIFRFDEVAKNVGCQASGSVARYQGITFFLGTSGFHAFDGNQAVPIGRDQVDETVLGELNKATLNKIRATVDPVNRLYLMAYPSIASTDGTCNRIAIFSWDTGRWTLVTENTQTVFNHMTGGLTLEGLNAYGTMETLAFSLDSSVWQGGLSALSCVGTDTRIARFEGDAKTAVITTGESQLVVDARAFVTSIRPLVQGNSSTSISVEVGRRDRLIDTVSWGASSAMNSSGHCPVRSNARYHRMRMTVAGGFDRIMGSDLDFTKEGRR
jgi:hypothetical protein